MHEAFEEIPCNLCGSNDIKELYSATLPEDLSMKLTDRFAPADHVSGNDRIVKCAKCGLSFSSPRIKREYIWTGYSDAVDTSYASQFKERLATFSRLIKKIEKYVPQKGRLLDIGCAAGFFLKAAKDAGWEVQGIEPNKGLANYGHNEYKVDIKSVDFLESSLSDNNFDVITFWDVLEHVTDPMAYIKEAFRVLNPGGYVIINFPDFGSPLARLTGKKWWFVSPVHIYYFTRRTLAKYFEKQGFKLIKMERHYQTLPLGYLFNRFEPYSKFISKIGYSFVKKLHMHNLPIRYYAGQALAIAQKPE